MTLGGPHGLVIGAPQSGGGKTVVTLGLLRHLARSGVAVASAKAGPDYIDPAYHGTASGQPCVNLDTWAMRPGTIDALAGRLGMEASLVIAEGVMGLFDGAGIGTIDSMTDGSTASLAAATGWPVIFVLDVRGQAASAAAVLYGFARLRQDITIAGVILNRIGGERHYAAVRAALARHVPEVRILGALPSDPRLALPSRHLGLVQAREHPDLEAFLDAAADVVGTHVDIDALRALAAPVRMGRLDGAPAAPVPPLGQRIAVALDDAFAFVYPSVLNGWYDAGAEVLPFSPLNDEAPPPGCDAVYLPGGYPELHAGRLAGCARFLAGLRSAAGRSCPIFGECGGYMVLGHAIIDAAGRDHCFAGLLPLVTTFASRRLHLGYRTAVTHGTSPLGPDGTVFRGHEFHYATIIAEGPGDPLFTLSDASGTALGRAGLRRRNVMGSFVHLIDRHEA